MVDTQSPSSRRCKVGASGHCIETHFSLIQVIITPHCQHPLSTARPDFPSTDYLILLTCFPLLLSSPIINTLHSAPGFPQHGHLHGVLLRRTKVTPRPPPHPSDVSPLDSFVSVTTLTHPPPLAPSLHIPPPPPPPLTAFASGERVNTKPFTWKTTKAPEDEQAAAAAAAGGGAEGDDEKEPEEGASADGEDM